MMLSWGLLLAGIFSLCTAAVLFLQGYLTAAVGGQSSTVAPEGTGESRIQIEMAPVRTSDDDDHGDTELETEKEVEGIGIIKI
jgi:hypothetical protein